MLQDYLRLHGIALSWIGTGRFIFSHDFTDADCAEFADGFVAAAMAMHADGWWWTSASLTKKAISRAVLREVLAAALLGKRRAVVAGAGEAADASVAEPATSP